MANFKLAYGAAADVTITLASLATSASLLAGRQSVLIDNMTNGFLDYLVSGKITTGTSPTAAKAIEIWCLGSWDGTIWPVGFNGTDAAGPTLTVENKYSALKLLASIPTTATSDFPYEFQGASVADLFHGFVPPKFALFVTHSTAVNLNSTAGNHKIQVQPIYRTAA